MSQDVAGSFMGTVVPNLALGEHKKAAALVAQHARGLVERGGVSPHLAGGLHLHKAGRSIAVHDQEVRRIGATVRQLEPHGLVPKVDDRWAERCAVDEIALKRRFAFHGLGEKARQVQQSCGTPRRARHDLPRMRIVLHVSSRRGWACATSNTGAAGLTGVACWKKLELSHRGSFFCGATPVIRKIAGVAFFYMTFLLMPVFCFALKRCA